ncbi:flagellar basal body protein, partial [Arthrospira platensis SPKY2]
MSAATADLRVTGNNIANSSTTGFKQSRAEFADVFAMSYSGISQNAIGAGVRLSAVNQQFNQ